MSEELLLDIISQMFYTTALLVAPILLVALGIGIAVSIIQAVTSIQEQTMVFIPKIFGVMLTLFIALPWMIGILVQLTSLFFHYMLELGRHHY